MANYIFNSVELPSLCISLDVKVLCECICEIGIECPIFQLHLLLPCVQQRVCMRFPQWDAQVVSLPPDDRRFRSDILRALEGVQEESGPNQVVIGVGVVVTILIIFDVPVLRIFLDWDFVDVARIIMVHIISR